MKELEAEREYLVQTYDCFKDCVWSDVCLGRSVDHTIKVCQEMFPKFNRIVVFENDSKEAVRLIKNNNC